jgi:hypothetical protein
VNPMIEFERFPTTEGVGKYEYHTVVPFVGDIVIRREATTHAYPRGASNPRWFTYVDGERRPGSTHTLAEAQQQIRLTHG